MSEIKLKPCPCCASNKVQETYIAFVPSLMCCECGLSISVRMDFKRNYKTELSRKWNTRKPMDDIVQKLEYAKEMPLTDCGMSYNRAIDLAINLVKAGGTDA